MKTWMPFPWWFVPVAVGALALLLDRSSFAEVPARQLDFPAGKTVVVDGVQVKAFTLEEYKTVATIYADYVWLWQRKALADEQIGLKTQVEELYALRVQNCQDTVMMLRADLKFWQVRVDEESSANQKNEKWGKVERFGLLVLVIGEAVALGAIGVHAEFSK